MFSVDSRHVTWALGALIAVAYVSVLAGGQTFAALGWLGEIGPARQAAGEAIAAGHAPGWWHDAGFGVPLIAEPDHAALYPPTWLAAFGGHALDVVALAHLWLLAIGTAALAGRLGADTAGRLLAGAAASLSAIAVGSLVGGTLFAVAWTPLAATLAFTLADAVSRRDRAGPAARRRGAGRGARRVQARRHPHPRRRRDPGRARDRRGARGRTRRVVVPGRRAGQPGAGGGADRAVAVAGGERAHRRDRLARARSRAGRAGRARRHRRPRRDLRRRRRGGGPGAPHPRALVGGAGGAAAGGAGAAADRADGVDVAGRARRRRLRRVDARAAGARRWWCAPPSWWAAW